MKVEIKIRGNIAAKRMLRKQQRSIRYPSKANREISIWLLRWVNKNFKTEGGGVGGWLPFRHGGRITPGGIDTKAKLLQDTGGLRSSFQNFYSRKTAGVGTDIPYALTHQLGLPHRNVPVRAMIPRLNDRRVESRIIQIYNRWIARPGR